VHGIESVTGNRDWRLACSEGIGTCRRSGSSSVGRAYLERLNDKDVR